MPIVEAHVLEGYASTEKAGSWRRSRTRSDSSFRRQLRR